MINKLNLGCGHKLIAGYVNIDNDSGVNPDHIVNIGVDVLPFEDNFFDEVLASHILEHINNYIFIMKELYRVCKHNATIEIIIPHHRSDWYYDDPTHVRPITINSFQLFSKKYCQKHIDEYSSSNGMALKENIDFEVIDVKVRFHDKWVERFKTMSEQEIADVIEERNNVIVEVYVKLSVIKE